MTAVRRLAIVALALVSVAADYVPVRPDGTLTSSPDVTSRGPGRLDLFVLGTDGQVYERFYEGPGWNGAWLGQGAPPPGAIGDPATAASDTMRVDLYVRGSDNELWGKWYDGTRWSAWSRPNGEDAQHAVLTSSPRAVSGGQYQVVVVVRGADGQVWSNEGNGSGDLSWRGWLRESDGSHAIAGRPAAAARGLSRIDVVVRGTDDRAYQFAYAPPPLGPPGPPVRAVGLTGA